MYLMTNFNVVLSIIGQGLIGVFLVLGILAGCILILNKVTNKKR